MWLFGLLDPARATSVVTSLIGDPLPDGTWVLGEPAQPDAWLNVHVELEPWHDNSGVEAGALIEAHVSSARFPESQEATLVFLRRIRASIGGQIRDDAEQPID